jgi:hypothetical protein
MAVTGVVHCEDPGLNFEKSAYLFCVFAMCCFGAYSPLDPE